ncbi:MAG TPA: NAD-dependent epimerase/dehydratase family protein, partial [Salinimicrobium sp.]|nr:NAD-dependent epimerase/dehydratase family protein [Salinimicrobium sp.]
MILVTGGTGLVGSHLLLDLVKSGKQVRAIHRKNSDLSTVKRVFSYYFEPGEADKLFHEIEWREADILNIPALEKAFLGIKRVFHCAALISFDPANYINLRKTNIQGTANVANLCIENGVEKLCHVSSIATFDKKTGEETISEASFWNPEKNHNPYAITKYGAEIEVWRASQEGVPVVIVNPGVIIGPGNWNSGTGQLFWKVQKGLKYCFPKTTGFVGVWDVAKVMRELMDSPIKNEQFIVVSENLSFKTLLEKIAFSLNKPVPKRKLRPWMVFLGWGYQKITCFFTGKDRKLTRYSKKSIFETTYYRNEKLKNQLNFEFEEMVTVIFKTGKFFRRDL